MNGIFRVVAISDISHPPQKPQQESNGRLIDTNEDDTQQEKFGFAEKQRCLKFGLVPQTQRGADNIILAFEFVMLPYSPDQLMNSCIQITNAEKRHEMVLLTPQNTRLFSGNPIVNPPTTLIYQLDDEDLLDFDTSTIVLD